MGVVWAFFSRSRLSFLFSFSFSLADGPIKIEILLRGPLRPNQPYLNFSDENDIFSFLKAVGFFLNYMQFNCIKSQFTWDMLLKFRRSRMSFATDGICIIGNI